MLPQNLATDLIQALLPHYTGASQNDRLKLLVWPGLAHTWAETRAEAELRTTVGSWFRQHGQAATRG